RHTTETRTETSAIEHDSVQRETDELYEDQSRVAQEGSDGERTITYQDHLVDGEVTDSKVLSNEVTTDPVDRVVEVGTAERPAPAPPVPRPPLAPRTPLVRLFRLVRRTPARLVRPVRQTTLTTPTSPAPVRPTTAASAATSGQLWRSASPAATPLR